MSVDRLRKVASRSDDWETDWPGIYRASYVARRLTGQDDAGFAEAEFIEAVSPPTVLALVDVAQAAEAASSAWEDRMGAAFLETGDAPDLSEIDDLMYELRAALGRLGGDTP